MQARGFRELVRRSQVGDAAAFEQLVRMAEPYLTQLARPYGNGTAVESVSDLTQEVLLQLWLKLGQFQGGSNDEQTLWAFRAWLRQVVHREAMRRRRDRMRQRRSPPQPLVSLDRPGDASDAKGLDPAAKEVTPGAAAQAQEDAQLVRAALNCLDDIDREIMRQRFAEGCSLREIANALGLSGDEVRARFHRALRLLERRLKD